MQFQPNYREPQPVPHRPQPLPTGPPTEEPAHVKSFNLQITQTLVLKLLACLFVLVAFGTMVVTDASIVHELTAAVWVLCSLVCWLTISVLRLKRD